MNIPIIYCAFAEGPGRKPDSIHTICVKIIGPMAVKHLINKFRK